MPCPGADSLIQKLRLTYRVIHMQVDGLSHADSLLQPPFRGNCLNWVLGHIVEGRNGALRALGQAAVWGEDAGARYATGSAPIVSDAQALPLGQLLAGLALSQERIEAALRDMTPDGLAAPVDADGERIPLGEHLDWLLWHETYHVGQLELLRQLAGKNDAVI